MEILIIKPIYENTCFLGWKPGPTNKILLGFDPLKFQILPIKPTGNAEYLDSIT